MDATRINKFLHSYPPKTEKHKKSEKPLSQNKAGCSSLLSIGSTGFFQWLVNSIGKAKRSVETMVRCDTGSSASFMDKTLVNLLKLKVTEPVMSVTGVHGQSDMKTGCYN